MCAKRNMAQYMDNDQYGEYDADHYDQHMEERLVEALDFHVQESVNKALVKALHLFAQPIFNFGFRCFGAGSGNPIPVEVNVNEPGWSSNDLLNQTVNTVLSDHEYGAFKNCSTPSVQTSQHSDSDSSDLDVSPVQDKPQGLLCCCDKAARVALERVRARRHDVHLWNEASPKVKEDLWVVDVLYRCPSDLVARLLLEIHVAWSNFAK
ncbi:hypothetical protein NDU88_007165 [Pleurodeles waltl]|uniref:Uncharacterized protein n=1 Tax=Pleurodeles waltl TaxID=8319 RepID=A0AAV7PL18_PLEWA|nr:hypothetical protein NDU88_007165 [Pleurodeles waltl]